MKYKKWIIAVLIIGAIVVLFLYPLKPDISGTWFVQRISTNEKEYKDMKPGHYYSLVRIAGSNMHLRLSPGHEIDAEIAMPDRHTLLISSKTDTLLNGKYEMTIDTLSKAIFPYSHEFIEIKVHLKSRHKIFEFSKTHIYQEPQWPKGIPRGRP